MLTGGQEASSDPCRCQKEPVTRLSFYTQLLPCQHNWLFSLKTFVPTEICTAHFHLLSQCTQPNTRSRGSFLLKAFWKFSGLASLSQISVQIEGIDWWERSQSWQSWDIQTHRAEGRSACNISTVGQTLGVYCWRRLLFIKLTGCSCLAAWKRFHFLSDTDSLGGSCMLIWHR